MTKASTKNLVQLTGEVEDCERQANQLGLADIARYLGFAKSELVKELAKLEARDERIRLARGAARLGNVIPFPARKRAGGARR